jgi:mycofactocin system transcriptional regulator
VNDSTALSPGRGRRPVTTRRAVELVSLDLFTAIGFDRTTIDDIATAAGIGRRTFFRYFASKSDIVWAGFVDEVQRLRDKLAVRPDDEPVAAAVRAGILDASHFDASDLPELRQRLWLIATVPALQAHAALRYREWERVIAEFAGRRWNRPPESLAPRAFAAAVRGAASVAYERWVERGNASLNSYLDATLTELTGGFADSTTIPDL